MSTLTSRDIQLFSNSVLLHSQAIAAYAEIVGMEQANRQCEAQGLLPVHDELAFAQVAERYGIGHNAALETLREGL